MQIVIDIPEDDYKFIKDLQSLIIGSRGNCKTIQKNVINAIKNGIPYNPSGESISRDSLKKVFNGYHSGIGSQPKFTLGACLQLIDNAPPVEPTKPHGKWIPVSEGLPEEKTKVLITNDKGKVDMIQWDTWWQNQTIYPNHIRAIAWMPLPEPYKETDMRKETENDNS